MDLSIIYVTVCLLLSFSSTWSNNSSPGYIMSMLSLVLFPIYPIHLNKKILGEHHVWLLEEKFFVQFAYYYLSHIYW